MNVLVIGCGMVGSALAQTLDEMGHDVSVIDKNETRFDALSPKFGGFTTTGVPIDRDVLKRAGIQTCDALFAVTAQDDMNIMVSQLARQTFKVPKIFARITDIEKGKVFEQLGVNIICPTKLTVSAACAALEDDDGLIDEVNFENHTVHFSSIDVPEEFIGAEPGDIEYEDEEMLFGVLREGSGLILYRGQPLNFINGDKLIFAKKG
ncbi:MAG: TrkA family potassium uptake protein [Ruminococcaceae bacterium]|nr:TrkA family potassium uptake protein [Oscillospiraceae bacterium]